MSDEPDEMHVSGGRVTRPCASCGGRRTCRWANDAWVCSRCGDEWYPEHGPEYAVPCPGCSDPHADGLCCRCNESEHAGVQ